MINSEGLTAAKAEARAVKEVRERYSVPRMVGALSARATEIEEQLVALPVGETLAVEHRNGTSYLRIQTSLRELAIEVAEVEQ